jgi:3-oxoacyl-[acyl-carrier protein] reductase
VFGVNEGIYNLRMNLELDNKVVVVVGGSKGIGLAVVEEFLAHNAKVHVLSRTAASDIGQALQTSYPDRLTFHKIDAKFEHDMELCRQQILEKEKNGIDILIANVGDGSSKNNAINEAVDWKNVWDTNFETALNSARVFAPAIKQGSITFISSICGVEFVGAPTDYSVAKSAVISFSKMLSHKLAPLIRVNVISPGNILVEGGSWDRKLKENELAVSRMLSEKVPLKRFGLPAEVSDLVLFLSSARASFITGSNVIIDGGQTVTF